MPYVLCAGVYVGLFCLQSDEIADSIASFAQLDDKRPLLVLLDIPEQKKYVHPAETITEETIKQLAADFKSGSVSMVPLRG